MSWLTDQFKWLAPAAGAAFGGPVGAAIGSGIGGYFGQKGAQDAASAAFGDQQVTNAELFRQQMEFAKQAQADQKAAFQQQLQITQDMFNKGLLNEQQYQAAQQAAIKRAQDIGLMGAGMNLAGNLAGAQGNLNMQLQLMGMQNTANRPYQMAQLGSLQALPYLQQLLGLPAYAVPSTLEQPNPAALQQNLLGNFQSANAAVQPMLSQMGGTPGAQIPGTPGAQPSGVTPTLPTALTPTTVDLSKVLQASPLYQLQQQQLEKSILRNAAANGQLLGTQTQALLANKNRELSAQEAANTVGRLQNMVNMGMGQPLNTAQQFAGGLGGAVSGNLVGNSFAGLSDLYNHAADTRSNLYEQFGNAMAGLYGQNAGVTGNILGQMGQNVQNYGRALSDVNNIFNSRLQQPDWSQNFGNALLSAFNGGNTYDWGGSSGTQFPSFANMPKSRMPGYGSAWQTID